MQRNPGRVKYIWPVVTAALSVTGASPALAQRSPDPVRLLTVSAQRVQGYLGVNFRETTDEQVSLLQLHDARGVEVTQVDHDGPACKAGVREHDVLLQLNGQGIEGVDQLRRLLHEIPAGRAVTLLLLRDGQTQLINTVLVNREALERQAWDQHIPVPDPAQAAISPQPQSRPDRASDARVPGGMAFLGSGGAPSGAALGSRPNDRNLIGSVAAPLLNPSYTGAALESLGPQLADFFGVPDGDGLLVRSVEGNSPAASAGLKAGDVVLRVNQVAVLAAADWLRLMHENKGRAVAVTILRDKREQTLTLTPDSKRRSSLALPPSPAFVAVFRMNGTPPQI